MIDLRRFLINLMGILFQFRCHICQKPTEFRQILCFRCGQKLENLFFEPELITDIRCDFPVYTISSYDSLMQDALRVIKYRPSKLLLESILMKIFEKMILHDFFQDCQNVLIPVPMHPERKSLRGFNQAEEIAVAFACCSNSNYSPALKRIRSTRPQADCSEDERLENLNQAFQLVKGLNQEKFRNRRLIVVDDVATTGTTIQKCAEQLISLNPSGIVGIVLSHSYKKT